MTTPFLVGFGEAMVRYFPLVDNQDPEQYKTGTKYLKAVGGDELNVCVDLHRLGKLFSSLCCPGRIVQLLIAVCSLPGVGTRWVSAIGDGPNSQAVANISAEIGIEVVAPRVAGKRVRWVALLRST